MKRWIGTRRKADGEGEFGQYPAGAGAPGSGGAGPDGEAGIHVEEIDGVHVVRTVGEPALDPMSISELGYAMAAQGGGTITVVIGTAGERAWAGLEEVLRSRRPGSFHEVLLVLSHAAASRGTRPGAAYDIAERWGVRVVAPDGAALLVPGGSLFVLEQAEPAAGAAGQDRGWWRFTPGGEPAAVGRQLPAPNWQAAMDRLPRTTAASGETAVHRIPAGVMLRPLDAPAPLPGDLSFAVPVSPDRPVMLVGAPGDEVELTPHDIVGVLSMLPPAVRPAVRLAPGGNTDLLAAGQLAADTFGCEIEVLTGSPLMTDGQQPGADAHQARTVMIGSDGTPAWRPFVEAVVCRPRGDGPATPPQLLRWQPPLRGVGSAQTGVVRISDSWQVAVARSGLRVTRVGTAPNALAERLVDADAPAIELGAFGQALGPDAVPALRTLLAALSPEVRERAVLYLYGDCGTDQARELGRVLSEHGVKRMRTKPPQPAARRQSPPAPARPLPAGTAAPAAPEGPGQAPRPRQNPQPEGAPAPLPAPAASQTPQAPQAPQAPAEPAQPRAEAPKSLWVSSMPGAAPPPAPRPQAPEPYEEPARPPAPRPNPQPEAVAAPPPDIRPAPPAPQAPQAPQVSQAPRAPQIPEAPQAPREPAPPRTTATEDNSWGSGPPAPAPAPQAPREPAPPHTTAPEDNSWGRGLPSPAPAPAPQAAREPAPPRTSAPEDNSWGSGLPSPAPAPASRSSAAPDLRDVPGARPVPEPAVVGEPESAALPPVRAPEPEPVPAPAPAPTPVPAPAPVRQAAPEGLPEAPAPAPAEPSPPDTARPDTARPAAVPPAAAPPAPAPAPAAAALPGARRPVFTPSLGPRYRSSGAERTAFRALVPEDVWNAQEKTVQRMLGPAGAEQPGAPNPVDVLAVHLYLTTRSGPLAHEALVASLRAGERRMMPYAACLASGLGRMVPYRGPAFRSGDALPPERTAVGGLLRSPGPVSALTADLRGPASVTRYALWSENGRRVHRVPDGSPSRAGSDEQAPDEVVFAPGSAFRVLGVREVRGAEVVLLREVTSGGRSGTGTGTGTAEEQDRAALAALGEALDEGVPTGSRGRVPHWPARCSGAPGWE